MNANILYNAVWHTTYRSVDIVLDVEQKDSANWHQNFPDYLYPFFVKKLKHNPDIFNNLTDPPSYNY
jgi:hypothetical protein